MNYCGRGDLLRILTHEQDEQRVAALVGYRWHYTHKSIEPSEQQKYPESAFQQMPQESHKAEEKIITKHLDIPFAVPVHFELVEPEPKEPDDEKHYLTLDELLDTRLYHEPLHQTPLLAPWSQLERRVAGLIKQPARSRVLDTQKLIERFSHGEILEKIPYKQRKRWPRHLRLIVDKGTHLMPFFADLDEVVNRLTDAIGPENVALFHMDESTRAPRPVPRLRKRGVTFEHNNHTPVLLLGDCGAITLFEYNSSKWFALGREIHEKGQKPNLLSLAPPCRWPHWLSAHWQRQNWQDRRDYHHAIDENILAQNALDLLTLAAHANGVEPGLLRELRKLLPACQADAGTEADVWTHPFVAGALAGGFSIIAEKVEELRQRFAEFDEDIRLRALAIIEKWRRAQPREIFYEELLSLRNESDKARFYKKIEEAKTFFIRVAQTIQKEALNRHGSIFISLGSHLFRLQSRTENNAAIWGKGSKLSPEMHAALEKVLKDAKVTKIPVGGAPQDWGEPGDERQWHVAQKAGTLQVIENTPIESTPQNSSSLLHLNSTRPIFDIVRLHAVERIMHPPKPRWAEEAGYDEYGLWATLKIENVTQKLRWISPGEFMMGSPENEEGRDDDEKQHHVTLTQGFWLFDTPVTQALWKGIEGDNPSNFKGDMLPVEQVSWNDCQKFIEKINKQAGLNLQLPTEAQWEYACRAGTTAARYHDDIDKVAWYTENSGGKTHPVGQKLANAWGLYDMLGNVREWCTDWFGDYPSGEITDPVGPKKGDYRVIRGGGWVSDARGVRAACRGGWLPDVRDYDMGFRCAQFCKQEEAEANEAFVRAKLDRPGGAGREGLQPQQMPDVVKPVSIYTEDKSGERRQRRLQELKPQWATGIGKDEFGYWTDIQIKNARQRLRWISPGEFMMGSPEDEEGRFPEREKQHRVTLTEGFWFFDTQVTQALWIAIETKNPSRFQGENLPVEGVSWHDCQKFIQKINKKIGMNLQLPTEAQWEYACRAGTTAARYQDQIDHIAWYTKNSDSKTHPVGRKLPNDWGLYDMLGNVWEWCEDWYAEDPGGEATDPIGPEKGGYRVIRGGSWSYDARVVRAASRIRWEPGLRNFSIGFRCAQFWQQEAEAAAWREFLLAKPDRPGGAGREELQPQQTTAAVRYRIESQQKISVPFPADKSWQIKSDQGIVTMRTGTKPHWAKAMGRDRFGLWSTIRIEKIQQRLRWIPPGQFLMGSPENEEGRRPEREKQHQVTLTRGFWLFDTPVTQALWEALMKKNPSRFQSPTRPVEQVSWNDCQEFLQKIHAKTGLNLQLPTEAQWEYACRAGTTEATYAGEMKILGENNAPILDDVAWYGGNSGRDFELENGSDSSGWKEKQYDHKKAGSHPIALKKPNAWGLYDMLGNVGEWCNDLYAEYSDESQIDPTGPEKGDTRVIRGGGWYYGARAVRAACRGGWEAADRDDGMGFRCAQFWQPEGEADAE